MVRGFHEKECFVWVVLSGKDDVEVSTNFVKFNLLG